jgi:Ti-type conjugative transfer relaxase TraA
MSVIAQYANLRLRSLDVYSLGMAIEFARVNFISRGKGHSVVAAMAYRAACKVFDERLGETYDYEKKQGVLHDEVLLPEGASNQYKDPAKLWNAVEKCEKRINAQLARELILALPADQEITPEDRIELARRFTQKHFVAKGLAAQINIHAPDKGNKNYHAHIMVTTRRLKGIEFDAKKARDLLPEVRSGRVIKEDKIWKDFWREAQNGYFKEKGLDLEVDPAGLISQIHLGKDAHHSANRAQNERVIENELRKQKAKDITLNQPDVLLEMLTLRQSVFSEIEIAKLVHKHTNSADEFNQAMNNIKASKSLMALGPKVENGREYFTTKTMFQLENNMAECAEKLANKNRHKVSQRVAQKIAKKKGLNIEQTRAIEHIVHGKDISLIVGKAGTGKSYALGAANEIWQKGGYNVIGLSLAKTAAKNLEEGSGIKSATIHSLLHKVRKGYVELNRNDVLVVDEAGMVDSYLLGELLNQASKAKAKIVLVGDDKQLNPIGPGAPFRALYERLGHAEMDNIRRQEVDWQNKATHDLARHKIREGIGEYDKKGCVTLTDTSCEAKNKIAEVWIKDFNANQAPTTILAFKNAEVDELNAVIRDRLKQQGNLQDECAFKTHKGQKQFASGDEVIFLKNDKQFDINNGQRGRVVVASPDRLLIQPEDIKQKPISIHAKQYKHINHAYAVGVYKAQGLTVKNSLVYVGDYGWNKNMTYVAMSRHKRSAQIFASKEHYQDKQALTRALAKNAIKDNVLDFPLAFAKRRDLENETLIDKCKDKILGFFKEKINVIQTDKDLEAKDRVFAFVHDKKANKEQLAFEIMEDCKGHRKHVDELKADWGEIRDKSLRLRFKKEQELVREKGVEKDVQMDIELHY